jgi:hypothetical protein
MGIVREGARVSKRATQAKVLETMRVQRPSGVEVSYHPPAHTPASEPAAREPDPAGPLEGER